jgi:hypothetical protein
MLGFRARCLLGPGRIWTSSPKCVPTPLVLFGTSPPCISGDLFLNAPSNVRRATFFWNGACKRRNQEAGSGQASSQKGVRVKHSANNGAGQFRYMSKLGPHTHKDWGTCPGVELWVYDKSRYTTGGFSRIRDHEVSREVAPRVARSRVPAVAAQHYRWAARLSYQHHTAAVYIYLISIDHQLQLQPPIQ